MFLPIKLQNGKTFHVEASAETIAPQATPDRGVFSGGRALGGATATDLAEQHFGEAVDIIQGIADQVGEALVKDQKKDEASRRLSEVGLELQLGFGATGKVLIFASANATASLKVSLKWTLPK